MNLWRKHSKKTVSVEFGTGNSVRSIGHSSKDLSIRWTQRLIKTGLQPDELRRDEPIAPSDNERLNGVSQQSV